MIDIEIRTKQLGDRLAELNSRLHGIEETLDQPMNSDVEDRSVEREEDEVLESLGSSGLKEIQMIEAALARVESGTFGDCAKCGEKISEQRLDLLPFTPFCRSCAV